MRDLTKDSIASHIFTMAAPVAVILVTRTAYQLVDLYFVTRLGVAPTAGVNAAGTIVLIVAALTQVLDVGTAALVAHAVGRKDAADANLVFNQSITFAIVCALVLGGVLHVFSRAYLGALSADPATIEAGVTFIAWMSPGFALTFPIASMSSALRGAGTVQPTVVISIASIALNALLAPVLIAGWGTGVALGVEGAGLASSLAVLAALILLAAYLRHFQHYLAFDRALLWPHVRQWRRILEIGLPAGGEFLLLFFSTGILYYTVRHLGSSAQAGVGIGARILQTIMLPAMAVAFTAGPIAGQNFGAKNRERVRETFRKVALIGSGIMIAATLVAQYRSRGLVAAFNVDPATLAAAAAFVQLLSWTFVAEGLVITCSGMFQGLGYTVPALISSAFRLLAFAIPALWLSARPGLSLEQICYSFSASVALQAVISLRLLSTQLQRRLPGA